MSEFEKAVNFCNQFLLLKTALTFPQGMKNAAGEKPQGDRRPKKYSHFEKVRKKPSQNNNAQQAQPKQANKKGRSYKMQMPNRRKTAREQNNEQKQRISQYEQEEQGDVGYQPIELLLKQVNIGNQGSRDHNGHDFAKTAASYMKGSPSAYQDKFKTYNQVYQQPQSFYENVRNFKSKLSFQSDSKYQGSFTSRLYQKQQPKIPGYYIPPSRSAIGHSNSCSDLSVSPSHGTLSKPGNSTRKKTKGSKPFFVPPSSSKTPTKDNLQVSRCTTTNHILAKFEKQILEEVNSAHRQEKYSSKNKNEETRQTRMQTKTTNKDNTFVRELDDDDIQLDGHIVRGSLSFLSEVKTSPKPITVELRK